MKPTQKTIKQRINQFTNICRKQGLPLTPQKQHIFEVLASTDAHPTARELHAKVKETFPTMSFATVYKNLKKFMEQGLVDEILNEKGVTRYDANPLPHHHLINQKTGAIKDVYISDDIPLPKGITSAKLSKIQINYYTN